MTGNRTKTIQELNDRFRKGDATIPGTVIVTTGVQALLAEAEKSFEALASVVQGFDDFCKDNDPYGEHDFGKFNFHDAACSGKSTSTTRPTTVGQKTRPIFRRHAAC